MMDKTTQLIAEVYRKTVQKPPEEVNMFSPEFIEQQRKDRLIWQKQMFDLQDQLAQKSEVFRKILQSELKDGQTWDERNTATNSPKSKTRNALLLRHIYPNLKDWEDDLLKSDDYWR